MSSEEAVLKRVGYSIEEIAQMAPVSKSFIRLEIARGNLRAVKLGRRVVIPKGAFEKWIGAA